MKSDITCEKESLQKTIFNTLKKCKNIKKKMFCKFFFVTDHGFKVTGREMFEKR